MFFAYSSSKKDVFLLSSTNELIDKEKEGYSIFEIDLCINNIYSSNELVYFGNLFSRYTNNNFEIDFHVIPNNNSFLVGDIILTDFQIIDKNKIHYYDENDDLYYVGAKL